MNANQSVLDITRQSGASMSLMHPVQRGAPRILALLAITFIAAYVSTANAGPCDSSADARKVYVRDYKALGDGKTDDGPALRAALKSVIDGSKPASLEFDSGKVYRIVSFEDTYALRVVNAQKVTLHGNGAELSLLPPNKVLRLENSSDINVCGLTIDYSPLPFTQGLVVSKNPQTGTFDVEIEDGFDVPEVDSDTVNDNSDVWDFAMPYEQPGSFTKRVHIKAVHASNSSGRIQIVPNNREQSNRMISNRTHLVMAMPGMGQTGNFAFQILSNERIHIEGVRVYAVPKATFYVANNQGGISFIDVEQRMRPGTARVMSGWRGVFQVKDNRAPIQWDGCYIEGAFDDAINLNAMFQLVVEKLGLTSWRLRDLGKDGAPVYKPGDRLQVIELMPERKIIGETKIVSVTQNGQESSVTLSSPLPMKTGRDSCRGVDEVCGSRVINLDAANEGSIIRNCTIFGSVRLRGKATLEHSKLEGVLQITSSPTREGPLPMGVVVKDSELAGTVKIGADSNINTTRQDWDYGERWATDIRFLNNRISSVFKAEGASFSLIDNDISWPKSRKFILNNCGPVYLRNLTANGASVRNPLGRVSIGTNMTEENVSGEFTK